MEQTGLPEFTRTPSEMLRVGPGFGLAGVDTGSTPGFLGDRTQGKLLLRASDRRLSELQERLFAQSRAGAQDAVLLVLQGMDTSGKGGIVRHVVGAADPQGISHRAFKAPTPEELEHDFLWRVERALPGPGMIGVFDRSHYEDVLIHRVHGLSPLAEVEARYGQINDFEAMVARRGIRMVKVMLHLGKREQGKRLRARLDRADKHWKYDPGDVDARRRWDEYQQAYQVMLERTSTVDAPWFVVPADHKWYARIAVQELLLQALEDIDPQWPPADFDVEAEKARLAAS